MIFRRMGNMNESHQRFVLHLLLMYMLVNDYWFTRRLMMGCTKGR